MPLAIDLAAPFDRLLPLREMAVEVAREELPQGYIRIVRAQPKRRFNSREGVFAVAEEQVPEAALCMRVRIVGIIGKRGLSLRYRRSPLLFVEEDLRLRHMGPRIVRLKGQSGVGKLSSARAMSSAGSSSQRLLTRSFKANAESDHGALVLRVES